MNIPNQKQLTQKQHLKASFILLVALLGVHPLSYAVSNTAGVEIKFLNDDLTPLVNDGLVLDMSDQPNAQDYTHAQENLWDRIQSGYGMPENKSIYTTNHEIWYSSHPDYVKRMVERSQKYLFHIVEEVQKRNMPTEIALLPMIESAFNPQAYSRSRASGIWQFVPATGKDFGLNQNWWVDNRRNVTAATNAALNYLQKLYGIFGSWDLALAAYNAGEGTVLRAIEKNRKNGLPTDYASLDLPVETKNYVPKLQAVKNIMTHPEQFNLQISKIPNQPYFAAVNAPNQIDSHLAAKLAGISYDEFISLNPAYNRPVITASGGDHKILLPVQSAQTFKTNLANYDKPLVSWQAYHAKPGERMDDIAHKFGIDVTQLRDVNNLPQSQKIGFSKTMLVPAQADYSSALQEKTVSNINTAEFNYSEPEKKPAIEKENDQPSRKTIQHKVKKGETLQKIAQKYGSNPQQLARDNHLKRNKVNAGEFITVNQVMAHNAVHTRKSSLRKAHFTHKKSEKTNKIKARAHKKIASKKSKHQVG